MEVGWRPFGRDDTVLMHRWLQQPHVSRWWDRVERTPESTAVEFDPESDENRHLHQVVIEVTDDAGTTTPVGWLQWYLLDDEPTWGPGLVPPPHTVALDLLIGVEAWIGRGVGPAAIRLISQEVVRQVPGCTHLWIDPNPRNERAMRAYAGLGFRDTGVDLHDPEDPAEVRRLMIATVEPGVGLAP
ncbi:acetyltransferase [Aquihabitans sp. G128]|uniref:GNAT family N-acetyltransferase n=1 Tax=Aquihabitans sp. G128 TaxID=2849779 RepID=UPI001C250F2B|nr:GNAT family N-acetyltransferase [Aquihabitans sp. G128]QXC63241.1 acetyltransferase [Aquihabitans sp. G128]